MNRSLTRITCLLLFVLVVASCRKKLSPETIAANAAIETLPYDLQPHVKKVSNTVGGYYSGLPSNYAKASKNYPLIITVHGGGRWVMATRIFLLY